MKESNVEEEKNSVSGALGFGGVILGFAGTAGGIMAGLSDQMGPAALGLAFVVGFIGAIIGGIIGTGIGKLVDECRSSEPTAPSLN